MKNAALVVALGAWLTAGCGPSDSQYFEVAVGSFEQQADCGGSSDVTTSDNSFGNPFTFEFFNGPLDARYVVTNFGLSDGWPGDTLEGSSMTPFLAKQYEGKRVVQTNNDSSVGGAHSTATNLVKVSVEGTPDGNYIEGTITLYQSKTCQASGSNCATWWHDVSCTAKAKYTGHKSHAVLKTHAL